MKIYKFNILIVMMILITTSLIASTNTTPDSRCLETEKDAIKIGLFSDPHYFSKALNPKGEAFENYLSGDRKLLHLSADITKETINRLVASDCDLIIVPGDLTKDGELICHEAFAAELKKLTNVGKPVYVICGNHDINNPAAVKFDREKTISVKSITPEQFKDIYSDFGYSNAVKKDNSSLSYVAEPTSWLRIIAMDSCFYTSNYKNDHPYTGGFYNDETRNWILEQIKEGKEKGQIVIGFMHHGIVPHLGIQEKLFTDYLVDDWESLATDFANAGMQLIFTGHFHAQDISEYTTSLGKQLWDVQTGSLVTYPIPYREIIVNKDGETEIDSYFITDIAGVENLAAYSKDFFYEGMKSFIPHTLKKQFISYGIAPMFADAYVKSLICQKVGNYELSELAARVITDYYVGDENPSEEVKEAIAQLKIHKNPLLSMIAGLLESYTLDTPPQDNAIIIQLNEQK